MATHKRGNKHITMRQLTLRPLVANRDPSCDATQPTSAAVSASSDSRRRGGRRRSQLGTLSDCPVSNQAAALLHLGRAARNMAARDAGSRPGSHGATSRAAHPASLADRSCSRPARRQSAACASLQGAADRWRSKPMVDTCFLPLPAHGFLVDTLQAFF